MKQTIIFLVFLLSLSISNVWADAFQFVKKSSGAFAVEAAVYLNGQFLGYSGSQGIFFINTPTGTNTFVVEYMGQRTEVQLYVSGDSNSQIKTVKIN